MSGRKRHRLQAARRRSERHISWRSIELRDGSGVLHGIVPGIGDREVGAARTGEDLERKGVVRS